MESEDGFFDYPRTTVTLSTGNIETPALYRDTVVVNAFFRVELAKLREVIGAAPFAPVHLLGGKGLVGISFYDHRDTTLGPYRECGVGIAVVPRGTSTSPFKMADLLRAPTHRDLGFWVVDLPLTSSLADVAGRELAGFPKFVTEIALDVTDDDVRCALREPDSAEPIFRIEGRPGLSIDAPSIQLVLYTVLDGKPLRSRFDTRGTTKLGRGRGIRVHVGRGHHPMTRRLAALGLDGAHPMAIQVCRRMRAVLHEPEPIDIAMAA